jgi:hypothetical protein
MGRPVIRSSSAAGRQEETRFQPRETVHPHRLLQNLAVAPPKTKKSRAATKSEILTHLDIDDRKYLEIHRDAKKLLKEIYNDSRYLDNYNLWDKEKIAQIQASLVQKHPLLSQCMDDWGSWQFVYKVWNTHRTTYATCMSEPDPLLQQLTKLALKNCPEAPRSRDWDEIVGIRDERQR